MTHVRSVVYTRASLDRTGEGLAVERQRDDCLKLAETRGWSVIETIADNDTSASNGKPRPGFTALLAMVDARQVDVVIVWAVDRLVRRLADLEDVIDRCERANVRLATVSGDLDLSTDQGRLVGRILASVARGEVERKGTRQRAANRQRAEKGTPYRWGHRPFGYSEDRATPHSVEGPAVESACRMLLSGGTISGVMREWANAGLRPPQGERWTRPSVREILLNPRIAGLATYRGDVVGAGQWEPLVPEETWRAVVALLTDPSRTPQRGIRTLLGGIAQCLCGTGILASQNHLGSRTYRCHPEFRVGSGPHVARLAQPVDAWLTGGTIDGENVQGIIVERLSRPDAIDLLRKPKAGPDVDALRTEGQTLRARLDDLAADAVLGVITRPQLHAATRRANARLVELDAALADAGRGDVLADLVTADDVRGTWQGLDLSRQRAVVRALTEAIVLHPVGRGSRRFNPDTIEVIPRNGEQP